MRGYGMPLADPGRTSSVSARPRRYEKITEAVPRPLAHGLGPPQCTVVSPPSGWTAYQYMHGVIVRRGDHVGGLSTAPPRGALPIATEQGLVLGDALQPWDGTPPRTLDAGAPHGPMMVARLGREGWTTVRIPRPEESIDAVLVRHASRGEARTQDSEYLVGGVGAAAIAEDGQVGVALSDGRVLTLNGYTLTERLDTRRDPPAYLISAGNPGWRLVCPVTDTDNATPPAERRGRTRSSPMHHIRGQWRSLVQAIADDGRLQWEVEVPFPVLQPPIFGGAARTYLVGKGLAMVEGGVLRWTKPANVRLLATCFGEGSLALAAGFQLRIVAPNGSAVQTLTTPDRSRIITHPSVGPEGVIHIGTTTGFYTVA